MLRAFMAVFGYACVRIRAIRREKLINLCSAEKISMTDVSYENEMYVTCRVSLLQKSKLIKLCSDNGYICEVQAICGIIPAIKRSMMRPGMIGGLAVFAVSIICASQFVWIVEVDGGEDFTQIISDQLCDIGAKPGTLWQNIDTDRITYELLQRNDFLTYVITRRQGVKLNVELHLVVSPEPFVEKNKPCDIIATRDTVIDEIIAYEGVPMVKRGDVVKKGDILISGTREYQNGGKRQVQSRGKVTGKVWYSATACATMTSYEVVQTGRCSYAKRVLVGGWTIVIVPTPDQSKYSLVSSEKTEIVGLFVPAYIVDECYAEVTITTTDKQYSEAENEAIANAERIAVRSVPIGSMVINKIIATKATQDGIIATVTLETIEEVGVENYY